MQVCEALAVTGRGGRQRPGPRTLRRVNERTGTPLDEPPDTDGHRAPGGDVTAARQAQLSRCGRAGDATLTHGHRETIRAWAFGSPRSLLSSSAASTAAVHDPLVPRRDLRDGHGRWCDAARRIAPGSDGPGWMCWVHSPIRSRQRRSKPNFGPVFNSSVYAGGPGQEEHARNPGRRGASY